MKELSSGGLCGPAEDDDEGLIYDTLLRGNMDAASEVAEGACWIY